MEDDSRSGQGWWRMLIRTQGLFWAFEATAPSSNPARTIEQQSRQNNNEIEAFGNRAWDSRKCSCHSRGGGE